MRLKRVSIEVSSAAKRFKTINSSVPKSGLTLAEEEGKMCKNSSEYSGTSRCSTLHKKDSFVYSDKLGDSSSECSLDLECTNSCDVIPECVRILAEVTTCLALDCEMVGVGANRSSALARCSVVNYHGDVVCDLYVKPSLPITDYRTKWSGIRKGDLTDGCTFQEARKQVKKIIKGCVLIGHSLLSDLHALNLSHSWHLMRDTSKYCPIRGLAGLQQNQTPSLKDLSSILLSRIIQDGEHCSVEDARAAMSLYKLCEVQWEKELRGELSTKSYLSDLYWPAWTKTS